MKSAGEEEEENQQCLKFFGEREKIQNAAVLLCVFVISVYDANISIISIFFCGDDDNNYLKAKTNKSIVSITKYHGENSNRKADMSLSLVHTHTPPSQYSDLAILYYPAPPLKHGVSLLISMLLVKTSAAFCVV